MDIEEGKERKKAVEIFCCYARKDQQLLLELKTHLTLLQRQSLISLWTDIDISPGALWEEEINKHLSKAQIILLLVSPAFMASDYCYSKEMKRAMEMHEHEQASVVPILLRPVDLEDAPFKKLQMLPKNAKPVTKWSNRDDAFEEVARSLRRIVKGLSQPNNAQQWLDEAQALHEAKRFEEALAANEQALRLDPNDGEAHFQKALILAKLGRSDEALSAGESAARLYLHRTAAYRIKATILLELKRYKEVIDLCDQAIKLNINDADIYARKGNALDQLGHKEEALEVYRQAIHLRPDDAEFYCSAALILSDLGRTKQFFLIRKRLLLMKSNSRYFIILTVTKKP